MQFSADLSTRPPAPSPAVCTGLCCLRVCTSALRVGSSVPLSRFHVYVLLVTICSPSDLLHSVTGIAFFFFKIFFDGEHFKKSLLIGYSIALFLHLGLLAVRPVGSWVPGQALNCVSYIGRQLEPGDHAGSPQPFSFSA